MFGAIVKKIIERRAGKYSPAASVAKGTEPVAYIGSFCALAMMVFKALGIDITEETMAAIAAGATALYGVIKTVGNYLKNKGK